ncbi:MAG: sensor histidine kinase [Bacteroidales bacterium]
MRPRLSRTTAGLAVGITFVVAAACAAGAYLYSAHHFAALLDAARRASVAEGELIRNALEHQMLENDRTLVGSMVETFGRQPGVANLLVLDRHGAAKFTGGSGPTPDLHLSSPTCQACHRYPPDQRGSSRVIDTSGGTILRTVIPIRNAPACHRCHDASHKINGIILFDRDVGEMRAEINRDLRWMVVWSGGLALVLLALIGLVVRIVVMKRLERFETTARSIAAGDLGRRVSATGSDTISWLAREFNAMADSITGLLLEVRTQRERLETVINSIDDGIVVLDAHRGIVAANESFLARIDRSRDEVVGVCCHGGESGGCDVGDCPALACLRTGERQVRICERRTPSGGVAWEEVHASPIGASSGDVGHVVEVWRDISERRAAEARLAESHRLASVGLLASGYSHELNTPLGTVLACVEGILRERRAGAPDSSGIGERLVIARDEVLRCRAITQQFLRLSRGHASTIDIVEVDRVVGSVARLIEPTARACGVTIDVAGATAGARVRADEGQLQQAIVNLMANAVQACANGGHVQVMTGTNGHAFVRVADDGCGIPHEEQRRIFEPFFSLRREGTGLGLFLSLNFVRAWGGDIVVESSPGQGSTFEIRLPAASDRPPQEQA